MHAQPKRHANRSLAEMNQFGKKPYTKQRKKEKK
jgi:hypothetical protein